MGRSTAAVLLMVCCCALLAATTLIAKTLGNTLIGPALHPFQVSAARYFFGFMTLLPITLYARPSLKGAPWLLHGTRTFFGWTNVTLLFAAVSMMPVADATAISFLSPVIAMLLAIPLLRELIGPWRWAAAALALAGALVLIRPGSAAFQPAALLALLAAFLMGFEMILIKFLTRREPPLRILLIANALGALISLAAAGWFWQWPTGPQWLLMALLGSVMVGAQSLFIQAMRRGDASFITPLFYTTLVFAAGYDYLLFAVRPSSWSLVGAALIIVSALTIAWRERAANH